MLGFSAIGRYAIGQIPAAQPAFQATMHATMQFSFAFVGSSAHPHMLRDESPTTKFIVAAELNPFSAHASRRFRYWSLAVR